MVNTNAKDTAGVFTQKLIGSEIRMPEETVCCGATVTHQTVGTCRPDEHAFLNRASGRHSPERGFLTWSGW